ncbi:MAG: Gfo/Idh/MocA family protein, partial [Blastocatellia bacterium]
MKQITRREFAKTTVAASAGTALSRMRILGANDRINLGIIGSGDRGMQIWPIFLKQSDVNPVAACDVYEPYLARAAKGQVKAHKDFRRLLEIKEIDAVIVATPDHWHALPTIMA